MRNGLEIQTLQHCLMLSQKQMYLKKTFLKLIILFIILQITYKTSTKTTIKQFQLMWWSYRTWHTLVSMKLLQLLYYCRVRHYLPFSHWAAHHHCFIICCQFTKYPDVSPRLSSTAHACFVTVVHVLQDRFICHHMRWQNCGQKRQQKLKVQKTNSSTFLKQPG